MQIFTNNADAIKSEMDDHILVILNKVSNTKIHFSRNNEEYMQKETPK